MNNECEICGTRPAPEMPAIAGLPSHGRHCPRCGAFWLIGTAKERLRRLLEDKSIERSLLSHRVRQRVDASQNPISFFESDLEIYIGDRVPPNPQEQVNNLILWIGNSQLTPEEWAQATPQRLAALIGTAKSADRSDEPGLNWLFQQIPKSDLFVQTTTSNGSELRLRLTMAGWKEYDQLSHRNLAGRTAFMAMKFGDSNLDTVLKKCFKPAVERAGFTLQVLSEGQAAGLIDNQIRARIRAARFVVADLSHDNNGAYFEAGFAEGMGLPVIYTCEAKKFSEKKTHFDTNHLVTIPWSLAQLEDTASLLTATVRATLPGEAKLTDD
jgi:hypothetical protein